MAGIGCCMDCADRLKCGLCFASTLNRQWELGQNSSRYLATYLVAS